MARNAWKTDVNSSVGIVMTSEEVDTVERALEIARQAMAEMVNDPGSSIEITWGEDGVQEA